MKKILYFFVAAVLVYGVSQERGLSVPGIASSSQYQDNALSDAYNNKQSDVQVHGKGVVVKIFSDDLDGSRHQKFLLKLETGRTLLVAHNIDLAPRINGLNRGDEVEFYGEFEWNSKGGVLHWTHRDSGGRHTGGWLKHLGKTYQ